MPRPSTFGLCTGGGPRAAPHVGTHTEPGDVLRCVEHCGCPDLPRGPKPPPVDPPPAVESHMPVPAVDGLLVLDTRTCPMCGCACVRDGTCEHCPSCAWNTGCG